ncbi:MAG: bile acid:sodium symporter family protein [Muribaculum sp.]|nr:bile acid:sodium symporter family protein [Muribaculum sp.]
MNPILIVIPILAVLMYSIGLSLRGEDFRLIARNPLPVIIGMVGQLILLPVLALGIAILLDLPPEFALGLVLIGCCPGGSSSNIFSKLIGGDVALSVTLTAISTIITLFTLPAIMSLATDILHIPSTEINLPIGAMLAQNLVLMLVPIILGCITVRLFPSAAVRIDRVLNRFAFPALLILITIFFIQNYTTFTRNFQQLWLSVTLLLVLSMTIGGLLSKTMMFNERIRHTIVIEIGMQNAAQAIAVASSPFVLNNDAIAVPAIVYSLMMNILLIGYVVIIRQQQIQINK